MGGALNDQARRASEDLHRFRVRLKGLCHLGERSEIRVFLLHYHLVSCANDLGPDGRHRPASFARDRVELLDRLEIFIEVAVQNLRVGSAVVDLRVHRLAAGGHGLDVERQEGDLEVALDEP